MSYEKNGIVFEFYDHAKNHGNVAEAVAVAKVRRELMAEGKAWKFEGKWSSQPNGFYWEGGYYDVLGLGKGMTYPASHPSQVSFVRIYSPEGREYGPEEIRGMRY